MLTFDTKVTHVIHIECYKTGKQLNLVKLDDMMMPEFKFMEYFRKICIKKKYIYITYSVVFVQFHWLTQTRDIQNI
jgi:hypothetical protein